MYFENAFTSIAASTVHVVLKLTSTILSIIYCQQIVIPFSPTYLQYCSLESCDL